jgi:hypothetical protein
MAHRGAFDGPGPPVLAVIVTKDPATGDIVAL